MRQLAFDLSAQPEPAFGNFVKGANAELVAALRAAAAGAEGQRFIYLWGEPASGRSHLLAATVGAAGMRRPAVLLRAPCAAEALDAVEPHAVLALDDVERLDDGAQLRLFALYNRMQDASGVLVAAASMPPSQLEVRPELSTRLAWGLVYQVHALSDTDKAMAMSERALRHGFELPQDVRDYVLRHARRDLGSLVALVDLLDRYSLETHRPVSVVLAREVLSSIGPGAH